MSIRFTGTAVDTQLRQIGQTLRVFHGTNRLLAEGERALVPPPAVPAVPKKAGTGGAAAKKKPPHWSLLQAAARTTKTRRSRRVAPEQKLRGTRAPTPRSL
jgi:hypothetical protein